MRPNASDPDTYASLRVFREPGGELQLGVWDGSRWAVIPTLSLDLQDGANGPVVLAMASCDIEAVDDEPDGLDEEGGDMGENIGDFEFAGTPPDEPIPVNDDPVSTEPNIVWPDGDDEPLPAGSIERRFVLITESGVEMRDCVTLHDGPTSTAIWQLAKDWDEASPHDRVDIARVQVDSLTTPEDLENAGYDYLVSETGIEMIEQEVPAPSPRADRPGWGGFIADPAEDPLALADPEPKCVNGHPVGTMVRFFTLQFADGSTSPDCATSKGETVTEAEAGILASWERLSNGIAAKKVVSATFQPEGRVSEDRPVAANPGAIGRVSDPEDGILFRWGLPTPEARADSQRSCPTREDLLEILQQVKGFAALTVEQITISRHGEDDETGWDNAHHAIVSGTVIGILSGAI